MSIEVHIIYIFLLKKNMAAKFLSEWNSSSKIMLGGEFIWSVRSTTTNTNNSLRMQWDDRNTMKSLGWELSFTRLLSITCCLNKRFCFSYRIMYHSTDKFCTLGIPTSSSHDGYLTPEVSRIGGFAVILLSLSIHV